MSIQESGGGKSQSIVRSMDEVKTASAHATTNGANEETSGGPGINMKDWTKVLVSPDTTILETIKVIDAGAMQIALVVDSDRRLQGTVTDGDIRRGILKGLPLDSAIASVMNSHPTVAPAYEGSAMITALMRATKLRQVPIVDASGIVLGLESLDDLRPSNYEDSWVVLMAGGRGSRLRPLTDSVPKPLLKIGDKPVLELILAELANQGFKRFYMAVNYKAEMVRSHFGDGSTWGAEINYVQEETELGTAGALTLLPEQPQTPLIVMNGDLITKLDFRHLLRFHNQEKSAMTMCVRRYDFQVPYGVVTLGSSGVQAIEEKPVQEFFVNAGIYVLSPEVVATLPRNSHIDMPTVLSSMLAEKKKVSAFPITEYWIDIGKLDDYQQAQSDAANNANQHVGPTRVNVTT
jgi:dTDP-glucose pyrophosphorylase